MNNRDIARDQNNIWALYNEAAIITEALFGAEPSKYLTDEEEQEYLDRADRELVGRLTQDEYMDIAERIGQARLDKIAARKREHMEHLSKKFVGEKSEDL